MLNVIAFICVFACLVINVYLAGLFQEQMERIDFALIDFEMLLAENGIVKEIDQNETDRI